MSASLTCSKLPGTVGYPCLRLQDASNCCVWSGASTVCASCVARVVCVVKSQVFDWHHVGSCQMVHVKTRKYRFECMFQTKCKGCFYMLARHVHHEVEADTDKDAHKRDPNARNCHGYRKFVKRSILEDSSRGYLHNDTVIIKYTIELVVSTGASFWRTTPGPPAQRVMLIHACTTVAEAPSFVLRINPSMVQPMHQWYNRCINACT
eukprot:1143238-Pelagomonas_calceolata.AAC.4